MTCDVRYVAEDAKLAFAFVRRGAMPELASHAIVPRVAGFSVAAELLLSGRTFLGAEAAELGLVTRALPAADVLAAAIALATDIAVNTAPVSVAVAKRLLWDAMDKSVSEVSAIENRLFRKVTALPDAREGIAAFVDKRVPVWTGKPSTDIPE
jgi:enoyl-CoA hydratase/carnithine racemase